MGIFVKKARAKNKETSEMSALLQDTPAREVVLGKAVIKAAEELGLTDQELANIIGGDRSGISRLRSKPSIKPESKKGELSILLIRLARALYALHGGDKSWSRHFMDTENKITGGVPKIQIQHVTGLVEVVRYADAIRGKV